MDKTTGFLLQLIQGAVTGSPIQEMEPVSEEALQALYKLAKKHELAHLAAEGLKGSGCPLPAELAAAFRKQKMAAIYSDEKKQQALSRLGTLLAGGHIPYLPLKGSKLREYYPQPWMRSRCDIDVLIHPEDLEKACKILTAAGWREGALGEHNASFHAPDGVHLELHFLLITKRYPGHALLDRVWDHTHIVPEAPFRYEMDDAMFYFYHVSHMAKHICVGGCGLRPFLDLWLLDRSETADLPGRDTLLRQGGLYDFAKTARTLASSWFGDVNTEDPLCLRLEAYIISGGVYGSQENLVANWDRSPDRILLERLFPPREKLEQQYPILKKHPWLNPVCQVARWLRLLFSGRFLSKFALWKKQRDIYMHTDEPEKALMKDLGLRI